MKKSLACMRQKINKEKEAARDKLVICIVLCICLYITLLILQYGVFPNTNIAPICYIFRWLLSLIAILSAMAYAYYLRR